jgi:hypothetical protein
MLGVAAARRITPLANPPYELRAVLAHRPAPHRGFEFIAELGEFVGGEI